METRANYTLIGLFTLAVIAGVFGFIYWFQGSAGGVDRGYYRIAFDGSVNGLRTGSSVMFNGIRVGEVTALSLDAKHSQQVLVTVAVDKSVPVYNDTDIGLEFQGLTGIASLSLKGGSGTAVAPGTKAKPPLLEAPAGSAVDVTQSARDVMRRLDKLIAENQQALHAAIENINKFSAALANSTDKIDSTLANVDKFSGVLASNAERFDHIAQGLEDLTGGKDGKGGQINETVHSVHSLVQNVDKRTAEITTGINRLTATGSKQIDAMSVSLQRTLSTADRVLNNIDKNPSRLIWGGSSPSAAAPKARQ
jgi:phospholipid/cholesterol/gamma-HCH transport system substrate-binding protein